MFFKAVFALCLAALALAAPGHVAPIDVGGVGDNGKLRADPCPLCTSLPTAVDVNNNQIGKNIGDGSHVHY